MAVNILIVDSSTTNRILLAAQVQASGFTAFSCGTLREAIERAQREQIDAVAINASALIQPQFALLRAALGAKGPTGIIATDVPDTPQARMAALNCGADAITTSPSHGVLFSALLRNILARIATQKDFLPSGEDPAILGFAEDSSALHSLTGHILVMSAEEDLSPAMRRLTRARITLEAGRSPYPLPIKQPPVDVVVIDRRGQSSDPQALLRLLAEMRARDVTRSIMQLVVLPPGTEMEAAAALDMGADDVVVGSRSPAEIAHRAGRLLHRRQMAEQFRSKVRRGLRAAVTDPLTGLANRRCVLPKLVTLSQSHTPLAVLAIDIDHFKKVNDQYGHDAGDQVLVDLANRLREYANMDDLLARIGGEEFLFARPVINTAEAQQTASALCDLIRAAPLGDMRRTITASVGVAMAEHPLPDQNAAQHLLKLADQALYASKNAGRDRVTFAKDAA